MSDWFAGIQLRRAGDFFCQKCETRSAFRIEQEPYKNGRWFISLICLACGHVHVVRDDLVP